MSSDCRAALAACAVAGAVLAAAVGSASTAATSGPTPLRVCADPDGLPFSNARRQGFENAIARLVAADLRRPLEYRWWPQRRGFLRRTLLAGRCDVVIGLPWATGPVWTTRPYYRSSFVFVTRRDRHLRLRSLDDPRLRRWRIGLPVIGDGDGSVPPAQALANRSIIANVRGYRVVGGEGRGSASTLIAGVAAGAVDVAIAWGPSGGYFAARSAVPLAVVPVAPVADRPRLPFAFDIAMAVRPGDDALHRALEDIIGRRHREIEAVLRRFDVPLVGSAERRST